MLLGKYMMLAGWIAIPICIIALIAYEHSHRDSMFWLMIISALMAPNLIFGGMMKIMYPWI